MKKINELRVLLGLDTSQKSNKFKKLKTLLEKSGYTVYVNNLGYIKAMRKLKTKKGSIIMLTLKDGAKYALFDLKNSKLNYGDLKITLMQKGFIDINNPERPTASFDKTVDFLKDLLMKKNKLAKGFVLGGGKDIAKYASKNTDFNIISFVYNELPSFLDKKDTTTVIEGYPVEGIIPEDKLDEFKNALKLANRKLDRHGFSHLKGIVLKIGTYGNERKYADYQQYSKFIGLHEHNFFYNSDLKRKAKTILHELGHYQWFEFKCDQDIVNQAWRDTKSNLQKVLNKKEVFVYNSPTSMLYGSKVQVSSIRKADKVGYVDITLKVIELGDRAKDANHMLGATLPNFGYITARNFLRNEDGSRLAYPLLAVSDYATTKVVEFWAEVFAHALRGSKPELLDFVLEITGKKKIEQGI